METRQIEFLKIYEICENVTEARSKLKVSTNTIKKWRTDKEFDKEYRKIGGKKLRVGKRISEEEYKERIEKFFDILAKYPVMEALKKAQIGTHKFMELKRNDKEFAERYNRIKMGSSKFEQRLFSETKKCICCGKSKPLAEFVKQSVKYKTILKTCNVCREKAKQVAKKPESKTEASIKAKLKEIEREMQFFAKNLDTENYISARRQCDYYKHKLEGAKNYDD